MRCPKCGYISFDQEDACSKCNSDLGEINSILSGTAVRVQQPSFLGSVLRQGSRDEIVTEEELEIDLADVTTEPEVEVELAEEEAIPMVDLSPFGQQQQDAEGEEEVGIDFSLPEDETDISSKKVLEEDEAEPVSDIEGTINFTFDEDSVAPEATVAPEEDTADFDFALGEKLDKVAESVTKGGLELEEKSSDEIMESEQSLPALDMETGEYSEPTGETLELESALPDIELESLAEESVAESSETMGKNHGLDLDIDVNLEEDEPQEEDLVFNLEDIDMSDLVIDSSKQGEEEGDYQEDLALDLEDFLDPASSKNPGIPMDLSMEDMDFVNAYGDNKDKKTLGLPDIEL